MSLDGVSTAVTGCTGFIGGALVQRLLAEGATVVAAGRRHERAADRLEGAELRPLDLTDPSTFAAACAGVEVLFHVAAWVGRPSDMARAEQLNVHATRGLVEAAAKAGVRRFVLVSTVSAYGLPRTDTVTEDHPLNTEQADVYGRTKAMGEAAAREAVAGSEMELVIVRPAMVYGPRSAMWTTNMLKLVKAGTPVVFGDGQGTCFPVYIDSLLDGMVLAATRPEAAGRAYHFADLSLPWKRWFQYYGDMCGRRPRWLPLTLARVVALAAEKLPLGVPLTRDYVRLYARPIRFDTTRARDELGWAPAVDIDEGMARSRAWLEAEGRL